MKIHKKFIMAFAERTDVMKVFTKKSKEKLVSIFKNKEFEEYGIIMAITFAIAPRVSYERKGKGAKVMVNDIDIEKAFEISENIDLDGNATVSVIEAFHPGTE